MVAVFVMVLALDIAATSPAIQAADETSRPGDASPASDASTLTPALVGTWVSTPLIISLHSDLDTSVFGPNASSVRSVELTIRPSGEGTLVVTRKVVDARGRTVDGSTSVETAQLVLGAPQKPLEARVEHPVKVTRAERTYPDDPGYRWAMEGLVVKIVTFQDRPRDTLDIRFETPEGRGSFWETLRRAARPSKRRSAR